MKNILLTGSLLLMILAACKKADNTSSFDKTKLYGTWTRTYTAVDANNNSIPDAAEKTAISSGDSEYMTFKSDGTLSDSINSIAFKGYSDIVGSPNGPYINILLSNYDTVMYKVYQLDDHNLVLEDTSKHPFVFGLYSR